MAPEDEVAFFRFLERFVLEVYPRRVPAGLEAVPRQRGRACTELPEEDAYLAASEIGAGHRGQGEARPGQGLLAHRRGALARSSSASARGCNEEGELLCGQLWAELDVTPQTGRRDAAPDRFRRLFLEIEEYLKKTFRKGDPKDFLVGPKAARALQGGAGAAGLGAPRRHRGALQVSRPAPGLRFPPSSGSVVMRSSGWTRTFSSSRAPPSLSRAWSTSCTRLPRLGPVLGPLLQQPQGQLAHGRGMRSSKKVGEQRHPAARSRC